MYDLNEVKTFVSVMETGNLRDSAFKLGVSKSTLSRRISHLENALNQPLLRRQANRLIANEAGMQFLPFAQKLLKTADEGHKAVEELKEEVSGALVVSVHTTLVRGWFTGVMFDFLEHFPKVNVDMHTSNESFQEINESDIRILIGEPSNAQLRCEKVGVLSQGLYASESYLQRTGDIQHPDELHQHSWVSTLKGEGNELILTHALEGEKCVDLPLTRLTVDQYAVHADAIVRGKGVGLLPHYFAAKQLARHPEAFVHCLTQWSGQDLPVYLQYPFGHLPKKVKTLIDYLKQEAKTFF